MSILKYIKKYKLIHSILKENTDAVYLNVLNLPHFVPPSQIRQRVQQIAGNCGGKMVQLQGGRGIVRFNGTVAAQRWVMTITEVFGAGGMLLAFVSLCSSYVIPIFPIP